MEFSGSGFWLCSMYGISLQMNAIVSAAGSFISANQKQFTILKCNAQQKQKKQKKKFKIENDFQQRNKKLF